MRRKTILSLIYLAISVVGFSQEKLITLDEIWQGAFRTERMDALHSMNNGNQYSVLNFNRETQSTSVDVYDYISLKKIKTLVDSKDLDEVSYFTNYTFSDDENKILLATDVESVYRRSTLGIFFVYDLSSKRLTKVSNQKIQEPTFSPDGTLVAYGFNNNIFVKNLLTNQTQQITNDGEKNKIINGITDWVYEEEFAFVRAFEWNMDSNKLAYLKFDETEVPEFSMDIYGQGLYQTQQVFKYPKAGENNAIVSLHIYNLETNRTDLVEVNKNYNDFYIPRIKWTNDADILSAQFLNRHQNELDLWAINANSTMTKLLVSEVDKAYVDVTDNLTFLKDNSFIWTSEKDGFNHIYHYNILRKDDFFLLYLHIFQFFF